MSTVETAFDLGLTPEEFAALPDHTQLPETDGSIVENFLEHPQGMLLRDCLLPVLQRIHPDGRYALGLDSGIYWNPTDPPLRGVTAPDFFYVPNVDPTYKGKPRRSYVMWKEPTPPMIVLEFASDDGRFEHDRTPMKGKFWIYENVIRPKYYGVFQVETGDLAMYLLEDGQFQPMAANQHGLFPIPELDVSLGVCQGRIENLVASWMRWYDRLGVALPSSREIAELEAQRADNEAQRANIEAQRADNEAQRAERLVAQLRAMGIEPDA